MLFWPLTHWVDLEKPLLGDPVQLSNLRIRLLLNAGSITILVPVTRIDLCDWNVKIKILWFFTLKNVIFTFQPYSPFPMPPHIYNFNNTKFITLGTKMLRLI